MKIGLVGEGMLELAHTGGRWQLGMGGDTLNVAIHLARFGFSVTYATALGDDPFSAQLRKAWSQEGIDTSLVLTDPLRHPGLYGIHADA